MKREGRKKLEMKERKDEYSGERPWRESQREERGLKMRKGRRKVKKIP